MPTLRIAQPRRRRLVADVDRLAADQRDLDRVVAEAVGDRVDRPVEHEQVGALADLDRAAVVGQVEHPGGVQRRHPERLERAEAVHAGRQADHQRHREHRRGPRVGVGREHDDRALVDQRPARHPLLVAEELGGRQQHRRAAPRPPAVRCRRRAPARDGRSSGHRRAAPPAPTACTRAARRGRAAPARRPPPARPSARAPAARTRSTRRRCPAPTPSRAPAPSGIISSTTVHPRVGVVPVGDRVRQQRRRQRRLRDPPGELPRQRQRPQLGLAREAVAGLAFERRRPGARASRRPAPSPGPAPARRSSTRAPAPTT